MWRRLREPTKMATPSRPAVNSPQRMALRCSRIIRAVTPAPDPRPMISVILIPRLPREQGAVLDPLAVPAVRLGTSAQMVAVAAHEQERTRLLRALRGN